MISLIFQQHLNYNKKQCIFRLDPVIYWTIMKINLIMAIKNSQSSLFQPESIENQPIINRHQPPSCLPQNKHQCIITNLYNHLNPIQNISYQSYLDIINSWTITHLYYISFHIPILFKMQPASKQTPKDNCLQLKFATQENYNHLFDYEKLGHCATFQKKFQVKNENIEIYQHRKDKKQPVIATLAGKQMPHQYSLIAKLNLSHDHVSKSLRVNIEPVSQIPALVIRKMVDKNNEQKGYPLQIGDVIRFGRVRYLVREMRTKTEVSVYQGETPKYLEILKKKAPINKIPQNEALQKIEGQQPSPEEKTDSQEDEEEIDKQNLLSYNPQINKNDENQKICRICMDKQTKQNFLMSPCDCRGSCQYIHFQCLKIWIDMKIKIQVREHSISFRKLECEICKFTFPIKIKHGKKQHHLINVDRPMSSYIMLETIDCKKKQVHILRNFPKEGIYFGRDSVNYIKVKEISVSRTQAYIVERGGEFLIFDKKSKFGTVIQKDDFSLLLRKNVEGVQLGTTCCLFKYHKDE